MAQDALGRPEVSMRSVASRVRHLGAARSGTRDLWLMRVTSLALLFLAIDFVCIVLGLIGKDLAQVRETFGHPVVSIVMLLFIGASLVHMKIGMQSIIDDYTHGPRAKELALMANIFFCSATGVAAIFAVMKLGGV